MVINPTPKIKCKNCNHQLEEAIDEWKKRAEKYTKSWSGFWHKRSSPHQPLGWIGRNGFNNMKRCYCGCIKPEIK